jgi:hypothetical protein
MAQQPSLSNFEVIVPGDTSERHQEGFGWQAQRTLVKSWKRLPQLEGGEA